MSTIFSGHTVCMSGTLSMKRDEFASLIRKHGGTISSSITKKTTILVTTKDEFDQGTTKITKALSMGEDACKIVSEQFVHDCIKAKKLLAFDKFSLADDGGEAGDEDGESDGTEVEGEGSDEVALSGGEEDVPMDENMEEDVEKEEEEKEDARIFDGHTFCISGTLSMKRNDFASLLQKHGGAISSSVTKKTTVLITTTEEMDQGTTKTEKALSMGEDACKIVSEQFIHDCIKAKKLLAFNQYSLMDDDEGGEPDGEDARIVEDGDTDVPKLQDSDAADDIDADQNGEGDVAMDVKEEEEEKEEEKEEDGDAKMIFSGQTICMSGTLSIKRDDFASLIRKHGGTISSSVTKKTTILVTTKEEMNLGTTKIKKALSEKACKIVSEKFVHDSVKAKKQLPLEKYSLADDGGASEEGSGQDEDGDVAMSDNDDGIKDEEGGDEGEDDEKEEKEQSKPAASPSPRKTRNKPTPPSKIFKGEVICLSGTLSMARDPFAALLRRHGATISSSVTKKTSMLVTTENEMEGGTTKVAKALEMDEDACRIVCEAYVHDCIAAGELLSLAEDDNRDIYDLRWKYVQTGDDEDGVGSGEDAAENEDEDRDDEEEEKGGQILEGHVICMSGTLSKKRDELAALFEIHGATVSSSVTKQTTLLVTTLEEVKKRTEKVKKALRCSDTCSVVSEDFIHDSIKKAALQDVDDYLLIGGSQAPTQKVNGKRKRPNPDVDDEEEDAEEHDDGSNDETQSPAKRQKSQPRATTTKRAAASKKRPLPKTTKSQQAAPTIKRSELKSDSIVVRCLVDDSKVRVRVMSPKEYNRDWNVQFPRNLRQDGAEYVVDGVVSTGKFYRATGRIRRIV
ncbi:hypothetical protein HK102_004590 [Quaeritorhiza haematococci]|nr:hypothetical protein HK102_004590 [Quaeritorhiza haematococci]